MADDIKRPLLVMPALAARITFPYVRNVRDVVAFEPVQVETPKYRHREITPFQIYKKRLLLGELDNEDIEDSEPCDSQSPSD